MSFSIINKRKCGSTMCHGGWNDLISNESTVNFLGNKARKGLTDVKKRYGFRVNFKTLIKRTWHRKPADRLWSHHNQKLKPRWKDCSKSDICYYPRVWALILLLRTFTVTAFSSHLDIFSSPFTYVDLLITDLHRNVLMQ